jgi:hypothetical protein
MIRKGPSSIFRRTKKESSQAFFSEDEKEEVQVFKDEELDDVFIEDELQSSKVQNFKTPSKRTSATNRPLAYEAAGSGSKFVVDPYEFPVRESDQNSRYASQAGLSVG